MNELLDSRRPTTSVPGRERQYGTRIVPLAAFSLSAICSFTTLFNSVWSNSVDVPFFDQWEVFVPFFRGDGLWSAFRQQFGPVRQGLGALVIAASNDLSGWNMRVLSAVTVCLLAVAMLVAVRLKIVLHGKLTVWDALIPPLFFRLSQSWTLASLANPTHGALPILLILCCCLVLALESRTKQFLILLPLAFVTVHTGFSNLFMPVLVGLLLIRAVRELCAGRRRAAAVTGLTIFGIVSMVLFFFVHLWLGGMYFDCKDEERVGLLDYLGWVVRQFSNYWGLADLSVPLLLTSLMILGLLAGLAFATVRYARFEEGGDSMRNWARYSVPLALISYSLAFSLASAWGRICAGPGFALASRYVTHMIPLGLGLFFVLLIGLQRTSGTGMVTAGTRAVGALLAALAIWGAGYGSSADSLEAEVERHKKLRWAECVRSGGGASDCSTRTRFSAYPYPELLDARIDYLRERKLSFFSPDWKNPDARPALR